MSEGFVLAVMGWVFVRSAWCCWVPGGILEASNQRASMHGEDIVGVKMCGD